MRIRREGNTWKTAVQNGSTVPSSFPSVRKANRWRNHVGNIVRVSTVKQDISADTLFPRLGDFAVPRILIFADAGTEHSCFIVLLSHISYFFLTAVIYFRGLDVNHENRENNVSAEISCFTV